MFEITAVHFGKKFPNILIKYGTSRFLYKFISLGDGGLANDDNLIPVSEIHFSSLINRLIFDIKCFHLYEVFNCDLFRSTALVLKFCEIVKNWPINELKNLVFGDQHCESLVAETKTYVNKMNKIRKGVSEMLDGDELKRKVSEFDYRCYILNR